MVAAAKSCCVGPCWKVEWMIRSGVTLGGGGGGRLKCRLSLDSLKSKLRWVHSRRGQYTRRLSFSVIQSAE